MYEGTAPITNIANSEVGGAGAMFGVFWAAPGAGGWPETDAPRTTIATSRVGTEIRARGTRFVATFRF